jgi:hypothetical protein
MEYIYAPQFPLFKRMLALVTILAIGGGLLAWTFLTFLTDPTFAIILLLILCFLALLDEARKKQGDPIGTVYHYTCNSCGHQWDTNGLEEHNRKNLK